VEISICAVGREVAFSANDTGSGPSSQRHNVPIVRTVVA